MGRTCTICAHDEHHVINVELVSTRASYRDIGRRFGVEKDAVMRHSREHIPELLLKSSRAVEVAEADSLLDQVKDLQQRTLSILDKAEEDTDLRTSLAAISQARGNLELLGKLAGELQQAGATNIHLNSQWVELKTLVVGALDKHPQAREDVLLALESSAEPEANGHAY